MWPYEDNWFNYLELLSLDVLCILTCVLNGQPLPLSNAATVGASLLVLLPCLFLVADIVQRRVTRNKLGEKISASFRLSRSKLQSGAEMTPADDVELSVAGTSKTVDPSPAASAEDVEEHTDTHRSFGKQKSSRSTPADVPEDSELHKQRPPKSRGSRKAADRSSASAETE